MVCAPQSNFRRQGLLIMGPDIEVESKMQSGAVVAILPCNDLDLSERFYGRLD